MPRCQSLVPAGCFGWLCWEALRSEAQLLLCTILQTKLLKLQWKDCSAKQWTLGYFSWLFLSKITKFILQIFVETIVKIAWWNKKGNWNTETYYWRTWWISHPRASRRSFWRYLSWKEVNWSRGHQKRTSVLEGDA